MSPSEKQKLIALLESPNRENYRVALSMLGGRVDELDDELLVLLNLHLKKDSKGLLYASSSELDGRKILEFARFGLEKLVKDFLRIDLSFVQNFDGLEKLRNLEEVRFYENQLTALPKQLFTLKKIKKLYIRTNPKLDFEKVCAQAASFPRLEGLYLENNSLKKVPQSLAALTQLRYLRFNNRQLAYSNRITEVPEFLSQFAQLEELNLADNPLEKVEDSLWDRVGQFRVFNLGRYPYRDVTYAKFYLSLIREKKILLYSEND